ncbi:MAG: TniB family NTP-binding protein [Shinella sp.]|nr:TniB family NTP-binding protein [Shinella sp.]
MIILPNFHEVSYANDNDARRHMLTLSPAERQEQVKNLLVRYPRFKTAYKEVFGLHKQGKDGAPITGEIVGFLGNSRAGKSWLLKTLLRDNKPYQLTPESSFTYPFAYVEVMDRWGAPDLATALYLATGASSVPYIGGKSLESKCVRRVASHGTVFVILDDAHYIFEAPPAKRKGMLSLIKALADSGACSVMLAGLNTIEAGMEDHKQLFNRASFPAAHLVEHDTSMNEELDEYVDFLASVSERLPFAEDSRLDRDEWIEEWKLATGGSVGLTMNIVKDAARRAIAEDAPCIAGKHLKAACFMRKRIGETTYPFQMAA